MFGTKFWEQIASGVAQKWIERLFSPALAFWAGGVLAYITAHGGGPLLAFLQHLDTPLQIALAVGGLVVGVVGSATVAESVQQGALRLLEGYWPRWFHSLRRYLVKRLNECNARRHEAWGQLAARYADLTAEELETYAHLDAMLATYPARERLLPTRLGNRLRAAEDYAWHHYGLATGVVWPRLWGVMPEGARKGITGKPWKRRVSTVSSCALRSTFIEGRFIRRFAGHCPLIPPKSIKEVANSRIISGVARTLQRQPSDMTILSEKRLGIVGKFPIIPISLIRTNRQTHSW